MQLRACAGECGVTNWYDGGKEEGSGGGRCRRNGEGLGNDGELAIFWMDWVGGDGDRNGKAGQSEGENNGIGATVVSIIRIVKSVPSVLSVFGISLEYCSHFSPTLTCSLIAHLTILTSLLV